MTTARSATRSSAPTAISCTSRDVVDVLIAYEKLRRSSLLDTLERSSPSGAA
jgi:hypothetical protein